MRGLLVLLLVTGCGRIGFDAASITGDGGDGDGGNGTGDGGVGSDSMSTAGVCGTTVRITDDFTATTTNSQWSNVQGTGVTVSQGGGLLTIAFGPSVPANNQGAYYQQANQDFTGVCVTTRVDAVGSAPSGAYTFFAIAADNTNGLGFEVVSGSLFTLWYTTNGGVVVGRSATFDPVAHRYLRIRESSGTYDFETSLDGVTYDPYDSSSTTGVPPTSLHVQLGLHADPNTAAANAGTAQFGPVLAVVP